MFGTMLRGSLAFGGGLLLLAQNALAAPLKSRQESAWPFGPFVTEGQYIKNTLNESVVYAGTNWPGHGEVMIPEGLQYQSIETIVSKIKSIGMNSVRLTYAIELIDQIYENGGVDIPIGTAFINALGSENGTKVLNQVMDKNPSFTPYTTRLQVYDAVAAELARQEIYIHLDNHMSQGAWCCGTDDGNSWWGDKYFNAANWTRGLAYMANHGKAWTGLVSMSLRNELRSPETNATLKAQSYNWQDWYKYIKQGTSAINTVNPNVIIFLSGLDYDTYMTPVVTGAALTPGSAAFHLKDFSGYTNKLAIEIHNYETGATSCSSLQNNLYSKGFNAMHPEDSDVANVFPVALTEFGFPQDATTWMNVYATCIASYMADQKGSWFIWVVVGSYYIRQGTQDFDETWGLLNHDWSDWRSPEHIEGGLRPMVENTASP